MIRTSRTRWIAGAVVALMLAAGTLAGVAATGATGSDDDGTPPITGPALERASAAALAHTGGGRVTETESGDEDSLYEVEVTMDDGSQVDVQLDADFSVVGDKVDREDEGGDDSGN